MNEPSPPADPESSSSAGSVAWLVPWLLLLIVGGVLGYALFEAKHRSARAHAETMEAEAALERAEAALAEQERLERRRRLADKVFPLPTTRNPFGTPRPSVENDEALMAAQIPPPPPRMDEIPSTKELEEAERLAAAFDEDGVPKLQISAAEQEFALARRKEADQDIIAALRHLDFANKLEPNHPAVLYRFGILLDKLGNKRRAVEYFQRVAAMDQRAGKLANLALHYLNGTTPENHPGGLTHRPLSIGPAFAELDSDAEGNRTVKLSLSIRAKAGEEIDPHAVVPYIYFYDLVNASEILPCDGAQPPVEEVNPWRSENPDYKNPEEELLDVTYHIPHMDDGSDRKFFGYVVKLYYRDEIQDVLVEPRVLVELLSEEEDQTELDATLFGD